MKNAFLLMLFLFLISCQKDKQSIESTISVDTLKVNSFEYKYKNEPKYFLKFWKNMTIEEFKKAKLNLKKEGIIDLSYDKYGTFYDLKIGNSIVNIDPIIEQNKVIGVRLPEVDENIYNLYIKKYNLPKLETISLIGTCYKEKNPCFLNLDCKDLLKIDKNIKQVPLKEVLENTNLGEDIKYRYESKSLANSSFRLKTPKTDILIIRENEKIGLLTLSQIDKNEHNQADSDFYYSKIDTDLYNSLDYDISNTAKYRYVVMKISYKICIEYYPNDFFKNQQKIEVRNEKKQDIDKNKVKEKQKELYNNI